MKACELRLGNYVQLEGLKRPIKVSIIDTTETSTYTKAKPILLTEEWLLKFRFVHQYKTIAGQDFFEIIIDSNFKLYVSLNKTEVSICKKYVGNVYSKKIDYVHQLQNLYFALTGEELTLKP